MELYLHLKIESHKVKGKFKFSGSLLGLIRKWLFRSHS